MTLPVAGNPISMSQVDSQLQYSGTAAISLNDTNVRNLSGNLTGANSLSSLYGTTTYSVVWSTSLLGGSTAASISYTMSLTATGQYITSGQTVQFTYPVNTGATAIYGGGSYVNLNFYVAQVVSTGGVLSYTNYTGFYFTSYSASHPSAGIIGDSYNAGNASDVANALTYCTNANGTGYGTLTGLSIAYISRSGNTITFSITNGTGYNLYISPWNDGTYAYPAQLYWVNSSSAYSFSNSYPGMILNSTTATYGQPLYTQLSFNTHTGTAAPAYVGPNACTQSQVISGMTAAVNAISGLSATSYTNGIQIIGATSLPTVTNAGVNAVNYTPTITTL